MFECGTGMLEYSTGPARCPLQVLLQPSREELVRRLSGRPEHFMPASLLDSQLCTLEVPGREGGAPEPPLLLHVLQQELDPGPGQEHGQPANPAATTAGPAVAAAGPATTTATASSPSSDEDTAPPAAPSTSGAGSVAALARPVSGAAGVSMREAGGGDGCSGCSSFWCTWRVTEPFPTAAWVVQHILTVLEQREAARSRSGAGAGAGGEAGVAGGAVDVG